MIMKIMRFAVPCIMLVLIVGVAIQYYITMQLEPNELVCHKGKLLSLVGSDGNVYTRVKDFSCDYEKGILIIEEQL